MNEQHRFKSNRILFLMVLLLLSIAGALFSGCGNPANYSDKSDTMPINISDADNLSNDNNVSNDNKLYYSSDFFAASDTDDCTGQFQQLIDTVYQLGGGTIQIGEGTYCVSSLDLRSNVKLVGCGIGNTTIKCVASDLENNVFIRIPSYSQGFEISELVLWGNYGSTDRTVTGVVVESSDGKLNAGTGIIRNCFIMQFSGNGVSIGKSELAISVVNTYIMDNENGLYSEADNFQFSEGYLQNNRGYGLINTGDYCRVSNMKSIWNGNAEDGDGHECWGICNTGNNCLFLNIETQDNWCNGMYLAGNDNKYLNITSDCNGYYHGIPEDMTEEECPEGVYWTPQDSTLLEISGGGNTYVGKCSQYRTDLKDAEGTVLSAAGYGIREHDDSNCEIYVTVSELSSVQNRCKDSSETNFRNWDSVKNTDMTGEPSEITPINMNEVQKGNNLPGLYYAADYLILPDGTDVTVKFQQLIDQVYKAGGGNIIFDEGTYLCSDIDLKSNVSLIGKGKDKTILQQLTSDNSRKGFIYIPSYAVGTKISELCIEGNSSCNNCGIFIEGQEENYNGDAFGFIKEPLEQPLEEEYSDKYFLIENLIVENFTGHGIYIGCKNYAIDVKNCASIYNGKVGIYSLSTDCFFTHLISACNGGEGFLMNQANNKYYDLWAYNNGINSSGAYGMNINLTRCDAFELHAVKNQNGGMMLFGSDYSALNLCGDGNGVAKPDENTQIYVSQSANVTLSASVSNTFSEENCAGYAVMLNPSIDSTCTFYIEIMDDHCGTCEFEDNNVEVYDHLLNIGEFQLDSDYLTLEDVENLIVVKEDPEPIEDSPSNDEQQTESTEIDTVYSDDTEITGGEDDCEHEWGDAIGVTIPSVDQPWVQQKTCMKCGAVITMVIKNQWAVPNTSYCGPDGTYVTGDYEIEGVMYHFDQNGVIDD